MTQLFLSLSLAAFFGLLNLWLLWVTLFLHRAERLRGAVGARKRVCG